MMNEKKEQLLNSLPFWDNLSEDERVQLRDGSRFAKYEKGAHIHSCTGSCVGLVLVVTGALRAYLLSEEGREVTLFRLGVGDICVLAASCVISQITFEAHISADRTSELLIISAPVFLRLKESNINVECFLYKLATQRFSDVMWAMQQLLFKGFDRRLAALLVSEAGKQGATVRLTHEEMASLTGSAREVVTRMLGRFADDGLVSAKRGSVTIMDMDGLRLLAN